MFTIPFIVCLMFAWQGATAQESPPAPPQESQVMSILKAADSATRDVRAVRYQAEFRGTGALAGRAEIVNGVVHKAFVDDDDDDNVMLFYCEAWFIPGRATEYRRRPFRASFDGTKARRISPERKIAHESPDRAALGPASRLDMREYGHPTPFQDEINARIQEYEGQAFVGDVLCDVVFVEYDITPSQQSRWYFGAEDHLPRCVERLQEIDGRAGAAVLTLTDLTVNPEYDPGIFALEIPEGYEVREGGGPRPVGGRIGERIGGDDW